MSALPSFEPQQHQPRRASHRQQIARSAPAPVATPTRSTASKRAKLDRVYAHRRQGLEVTIKLVTYSTLSLVGIVTLTNALAYNWSQQGKLKYLSAELKDARIRTTKVNNEFSRSFAPELEKSVMEENSYKVAADRLDIIITNPAPAPTK